MPERASAAGEAFEVVCSRYLSEMSGLRHLAAPFYTHLARGRWAQFDGLFSRGDGRRLLLEAKFYSTAVSLVTPGIAARITFVKEAGADGIIISSRNGFERDIMQLKLPMEKVLLSWAGMKKRLSEKGRGPFTACLDRVTLCKRGFVATSGVALILDGPLPLAEADDGFAFVPAEVERWLRRLPASEYDIDLAQPRRRSAARRGFCIEKAWVIEDSLRGFAPSDPRLMEAALAMLTLEPMDLAASWKTMWRRGYRGRKGGLKNALDNLCVIGATERFRTAKGLFYGLVPTAAKAGDASRALAHALRAWPAYAFFKSEAGLDAGTKYAVAARLSDKFKPFFPYARSLYNPAKVAGLLALDSYLSGTSMTRPS